MIRATRARVTNCRMKVNDLYARLHDIIYYPYITYLQRKKDIFRVIIQIHEIVTIVYFIDDYLYIYINIYIYIHI